MALFVEMDKLGRPAFFFSDVEGPPSASPFAEDFKVFSVLFQRPLKNFSNASPAFLTPDPGGL